MSTSTRPAETLNGVTTSWVPLVTPGPSLSPECSSAFYLNPQNPASIGAFDPWYGQNVNTALQCQAPQQTTWWDQLDLSSSTLWNLGPLACPNGYSTATTQSINAQSTVLACCPSGFNFRNGILAAPDANECLSTLTSGQVITPMSSVDGSWIPTTMTILGTGSVIHGVQINGWNFASSSSTSILTSSSSSSSSTTTDTPSTVGTVTVTSVAGASASTTSSSSTVSGQSVPVTAATNGGLSNGAKAGIGIAITLSSIAILCFAAFLVLRRRRGRVGAQIQNGFMTPPDYYGNAAAQSEMRKAEKYGGAPMQYVTPVEVSAVPRMPPVEMG